MNPMQARILTALLAVNLAFVVVLGRFVAREAGTVAAELAHVRDEVDHVHSDVDRMHQEVRLLSAETDVAIETNELERQLQLWRTACVDAGPALVGESL